MDKISAQKRIEKLALEIGRLRRLYHVENDPRVTDDIYESLTRELKDLFAKYPEFDSIDLGINRVAGEPLPVFQKYTHASRMLSLNDAFSREEVLAWDKRVKKILESQNVEYFAELKLDGLAVSLIYENKKFVRGATRGDGFIGEDVTQNLKMVESIPLTLPALAPDYLEVRGEIIMRKVVWEKINQQNKREGKALFANTRNAAAGALRQLDPALTKARRLDFVAWNIVPGAEKKFPTHEGEHKALRDFGFLTTDTFEKTFTDFSDLFYFIDEVGSVREKLPFGTDGIVIQVNDSSLHNILGVVGKAPRYAVAYKYPAERATTTVTDITVQVGRTGVLTPLAHFVPTLVAGSRVSKATLHNIDQIERLDIRVGDTVVIQKAGDVIPEVVEVLKDLRDGNPKKFGMPKKCPVCNGEVEKKENQGGKSVAYYCVNKNCGAKNTRGITHFINSLEIYEVGPKIVARLQDEGLISDAGDLFALTEADLSGLERFGEKSAKNIIESIASHKNPPLPRFIMSLGIIHVGEETALDLAKYFKKFEKIKMAKIEEFDAIENIGPAVSESIVSYFSEKKNKIFLEKLESLGVAPQEYKEKGGVKIFAGKIFVLTGTLPTLARGDAKKMIVERGGKVSGSVSKATNFVLLGENAGSKLSEAEKLGVKTISEEEFLKMIS
jgi:DNA ligase (NAD+)